MVCLPSLCSICFFVVVVVVGFSWGFLFVLFLAGVFCGVFCLFSGYAVGFVFFTTSFR